MSNKELFNNNNWKPFHDKCILNEFKVSEAEQEAWADAIE